MIIDNLHRFDACVLCGSDDIKHMGSIDYRTPIMFSTTPITLTKTPELSSCEACNSWFSQNIISDNQALLLYSMGSSEEKWPRYVAFEKTKNDKIISALNDYLMPNGKVLDVGCNTGMLLDYAKKRGCKTYGVEPSAASRKTLESKGHISFKNIQDVSGGYDVITAFDLVEHLYDIPKFFRSMHALLKEGGVLIILTGNPQSLSAKISSNNWWYLKAPEHIVFPSLKYIQSVSGYKLINHIYSYASLGYERNIFISIAQLIRKTVMRASYIGLPSIGPDHFLAIMKKCNKSE